MAQLSDDCFAFGGPMMPVDEAVRLITARVKPVGRVETVPLADADGRVLARDIAAPLPLPPFTNSAVDGYAVRSEDIPKLQEQALVISDRIAAGDPARAPLEPGKAARIFTGAPMPEGAGTVYMQEDVRLDEAGRVILPAGLSPGEVRGAAQLFDSNRFMLLALLRRLGCEVGDLGILRDDRASLAQALQRVAAQHDLILTTGGVSTGEEDHVRAAVESVGTLVLWRMAIKPGRPVAMGMVAGTPLIGLPGNPVASFVTFVHVVRPAVLALSGASPEPLLPIPVRAAFGYKKKSGRREYVRVSLRRAADGSLEAGKFPREGAGLLSSLIETDGLVELTEAVTNVQPGDSVGFLPYASLF